MPHPQAYLPGQSARTARGSGYRHGLLALLILVAILVVLYLGLQKNMSKSVQLDSGKAYFWKVVVEDGQGGTSESEMRRFATR